MGSREPDDPPPLGYIRLCVIGSRFENWGQNPDLKVELSLTSIVGCRGRALIWKLGLDLIVEVKIWIDQSCSSSGVGVRSWVGCLIPIRTSGLDSKVEKNVVAGTSVATARTNAATSNVVAGTSAASAGINVATSDFTNAAIGSQSSVNAGPSARRPTNASLSSVRPATTLTSGGRPTSATSSDVRPLSTQQSTSSAAGQKRKTSTTLRGGATLAYKRPRQKKAKTAGYDLLFGSGGSVTERVWCYIVLHCQVQLLPILILVTNPGLSWKGRAAITQRHLRDESYRSTQGTHATPSTQGTH
ncbi:hypothetical protein MTR67_034110 [Solanum verrucosum]|uniref:Uncharacterized protein n=1 Tax=Solanum verrucosum TaxID=315347 RepID=A0AAF0U7L8_SOLVR|nr:hypothetical protein MTR67_034110 [Solanum verrucosum]